LFKRLGARISSGFPEENQQRRTAWDKMVWVKASEMLARNVAPSSSRMEEVECRKLSVV
jgi:hypothetical protein